MGQSLEVSLEYLKKCKINKFSFSKKEKHTKSNDRLLPRITI